MAVQSAFYFTDGTTRTFPSTKHIAFSTNAAVWMKRVVDDVWELTSHELWTLSQNSIVFTVAPQSTVYSQIELRVADDADELTENPSNIALVAGSIVNVDIVATNINAVNTVSTNITAVQNVSANETNINTVATDIANVNNVAIQVIPNLSEILLADDNATIATNKALEASNSATTALTKASEAATYASNALTSENNAIAAAQAAGVSADEVGTWTIASPFSVATIGDLSAIDTNKYTTAIVKDLDRGGTFIWSATGTANGGTVFAGATGYWIRQYSGAINVKWFGARGDGLTDCADSIIEAGQSTTGSILIPGGDFVATLTAGNASDIGDLLGRLDIKGSLQLNIAPTTLQFTRPFKFFSGCNRVNGLKVVGSAPVSVSISGQLGVSGTAGAYAVQLQLSTVAGVSAGDFLHTTGVVGTGIPEVHRGVWEITAVDVPNSSVMVKNTCHTSTFPINNITSSTSVVLKSILKFNGCDAFVVAGGRIDYLNNVAIVGNSDEYWLSTNVTGTEKGTNGLVIGSQTIAVNGKSDNSNQYGVSLGHVSAGPNVGISGFDQQGIITELGGSFCGDFVSSCNNKRRGFYASTSSGIRAKHISANGNFLDGLISDIGGNIYSSSVSCAIGNGSRGVSVSHGGTLVFDTGIMSCNVSDGAACVLGGVLQATAARYESNGGCGVFADYGSKAVVNNSVMSGNTRYGLDIDFNATARANNCTFNNNGLHGIRATDYAFGVITSSTFSGNASGDKTIRGQGMLLDGSSYTVGEVRGTTFRSIAGAAGQGIRMASTSGGDDIIFSHDTTGGGTYTNKWHMRSGNAGFYSETDADTPIGRPANRFSTVYTRNINMTPPASAVPAVNGETVFQLTSDTQLTIKVKGSDGVVRNANITLS